MTDSRGRTATKTESVSVSDYSNPVVSQVSAVRCISDGTPNNDGTYVSVTATLSVTSLSGNNPIAFALSNTKRAWDRILGCLEQALVSELHL